MQRYKSNFSTAFCYLDTIQYAILAAMVMYCPFIPSVALLQNKLK